MPTYIIVEVTVSDPEAMAEYASKTAGVLHRFGGRFIARGASPEVIEGDWHPRRISIVEFPSVADVHRWYESDEYAALKQMRHAAAQTRIVLIDGNAPPT